MCELHPLTLLLLTGLQRSEVLGAKWSYVDWQRRTLQIGKTKNGEVLLARLNHAAITRLKRIPRSEDNEYIICGQLPGQPLASIDSTWRRVLKKAQLTNLRIHDLRRTVGSWLVQDGASLHLVGVVLNHKDPKTTAGYAYSRRRSATACWTNTGRIYLPPRYRKTRAPTAAPERLGRTPLSRRRLRRFSASREELYVRVWSEPISKLAAQWAISMWDWRKSAGGQTFRTQCCAAYAAFPPRSCLSGVDPLSDSMGAKHGGRAG